MIQQDDCLKKLDADHSQDSKANKQPTIPLIALTKG